MTQDASPAFQFYINDWRGSRSVQRMTYDQRGRYLEMLIEQWDAGSVPDDPRAVAALFGDDEQGWLDAWAAVRRRFVDRRAKQRPGCEPAPHDPTDHDANRRLINIKLENMRQRLTTYKKERAASGRDGGLRRARNVKERQELDVKLKLADLGKTLANPSSGQANPGSSSSSSSSSSTSSSISLQEQERASIPESLPPTKPHPLAVDVNAQESVEQTLANRGGWLVERYQELFQERRGGARYRPRPNMDWVEACDLCRIWPDARLEKLATLILTTDDEFISRTDRSFKIFAMKASWADDRLSQWEASRKASA